MNDVMDGTRRCPICGKRAESEHRPFCSRRCAVIDLGRWLKEDYRIPSREQSPPAGETDSDE